LLPADSSMKGASQRLSYTQPTGRA